MTELPTLSSQSDPQAGSECERKGGKAEDFFVVLIGEIFDCGIEAQVRVQAQASTEINLLVRLCQILVGQQHGCAEEGIGGEGAVIAAAHKITAQAERVS